MATDTHTENVTNAADTQSATPANAADGSQESQVIIDAPDQGEFVEVFMQPGTAYQYNFSQADIRAFAQEGQDLEIVFNNEGTLVLRNYTGALSDEDPAKVSFVDSGLEQEFEALFGLDDMPLSDELEFVETEEEPQADLRETDSDQAEADVPEADAEEVILEAMEPTAAEDTLAELAEELAEVEPAAGEPGAGGRGGYGFQSDFSPTDLVGINDVGPIGPTALQYGVEFRGGPVFPIEQAEGPGDDNPFAGSEERDLDETDLENGPLQILDGEVFIDFGADGPGEVCTTDTFIESGSLKGGDLTSGGLDVEVTSTPDGYVGMIDTNSDGTPDTVVFELTLNQQSGELGKYTYTQFLPFDHADGTDDNDVITLNFGIKAADSDGDQDTTFITINVADDDPDIDDDSGDVDETNLGPIVLPGDLNADFGEDGAGEVCGNDTFNFSGSAFNNQLSSGGDPIDVTFDSNTNTYTGETGGGDVIFELVINADGTYTFTLHGPLDHADANDPNDIITLEFGAKIIDFDDDTENATITINVADDAPTIPGDGEPEIGAGKEVVDETDDIGDTVGGDLNVDFGTDGAGGVSGNDIFNAGGSLKDGDLTSGDEIVDVTFDSDTNTYTGETAGGETIFTLTVNADGTYEFTLLGPLDHADPNDPNDVIELNFGVQAEDSDGDTAQGNIQICVKDDAPFIGDDTKMVDETDLPDDDGSTAVSGSISFDFGEDGSELSAGDVPQGLTSGGEPVDVTFSNDVFTGMTQGGEIIFTLTVDPVTGDYTFELFGPLDHPDDMDPNDILNLDFDVVVTDEDGDSETGAITIQVKDDGPVVGDGMAMVDESDIALPDQGDGDADPVAMAQVQGQIEIDLGADGAGGIESVSVPEGLTSGGQPVIVTPAQTGGGESGNGLLFTGEAGGETIFTLEVDANGNYTFTLFGPLDHPDENDPNDILELAFEIIGTDGDDDTDTGTIIIKVKDDGPMVEDDNPAIGDGFEIVDETDDLDNGDQDDASGQLVIDTGEDTPVEVSGTDQFMSGGSLKNGDLTSGGEPVDVEMTPGQNGSFIYTGTAGGESIFELTVNADGSYDFKLLGTLDHADPDNPDDIIELKFGVQAEDSDGDSDDGFITIHVKDDGPVAVDDTDTSGEGEAVSGNVMANDDVGADVDGTVTEVTIGGNTVSVPNGGSNTIDGQFGTLELFSDGSYTYTPFPGAEGTDVFTYTLMDFDMDTDTATLSIRVDDTGPVVGDDKVTVDETDLDDNGQESASNTVDVDFGADGIGSVTGNDTFNVGGDFEGPSLTSGNEIVDVTFDANTNTYTGTAGGTDVFTLTINPDTGDYTFELLGPLDHGIEGNDNEILDLNFGYTATDGDGDSVNGTIQVCVHDDGPVLTADPAKGINESQLDNGPIVKNGDLVEDFGADDGDGSMIMTNGDPVLAFQIGGAGQDLSNLKSGGDTVEITQTATGYVGKVGSETIFELTINPQTGQYTYTQHGPIDHPGVGETGTDDVVWLKFPVKIVDADGDTDTAFIQIDIRDDGPVAEDDTDSSDDGALATGNVLINDDAGADEPDSVEQISFGNQTVDVPNTGFATINGQFGQLKIAADGSYTYDPFSDNADGTDVFTYVMKDFDGDTDSANLTIRVSGDDTPIIVGNEKVVVDETDMADDGKDSAGGVINVDTGDDGLASVSSNGAFSFGGEEFNGTLTSNQAPVTVEATADGYIGFVVRPGGLTEIIFKLDIADNGSYNFTLLGPLDHGDPTDPDDVIDLHFGFTATDTDGDSANGTINVCVHDDGPFINAGSTRVDEENLHKGEIGFGFGNKPPAQKIDFDYGEDGQGLSGDIGFTGSVMAKHEKGGELVALRTASGEPIEIVTLNDGGTLQGVVGNRLIFELILNKQTGEYSYRQLEALEHEQGLAGQGDDVMWLNVEVKITDDDGDSDTAIVQIDVVDDSVLATDDINNFSGGDTFGDVITGFHDGKVTSANDLLSDDGGNGILAISADHQNFVALGNDDTAVINGQFGTLTIHADGTYTYEAFQAGSFTDTFTYRLGDADGDVQEAVLTLNSSAPADSVGTQTEVDTTDFALYDDEAEMTDIFIYTEETGEGFTTMPVDQQIQGDVIDITQVVFDDGGSDLQGAINEFVVKTETAETQFVNDNNGRGEYDDVPVSTPLVYTAELTPVNEDDDGSAAAAAI